MNDVERAVERLTQEHTEHTEAGPVDWPPLITWLKSRVTEINSRGAGKAGPGIPLNNDALDLLNYIEKQYRLICAAVTVGAQKDLRIGIAKTWQVIKNDRAQGHVDDAQLEKIMDEIQSWVTRIETEQDRPRKMELTVPCPRCGTRWILDDGDRKAAVTIEFAEGRAPVAECRTEDCGAIWAGWADMTKLGFTVGAEANMEVLKACGIDTPTLGELH